MSMSADSQSRWRADPGCGAIKVHLKLKYSGVIVSALLVSLWASLAQAEEGRYRIDPSASAIRIITDKSGFFGAMAHQHVINLGKIEAEIIVADEQRGETQFELRPETFRVDDPADTARYKKLFKKPASAKTASGTRTNMLSEKLLDAVNFPTIKVNIELLNLDGEQALFDVTIELKGNQIKLEIPGTLSMGEARLSASAEFTTSNEALGLEVFRALAGTIAVGKELKFSVSIEAHRLNTH